MYKVPAKFFQKQVGLILIAGPTGGDDVLQRRITTPPDRDYMVEDDTMVNNCGESFTRLAIQLVREFIRTPMTH